MWAGVGKYWVAENSLAALWYYFVEVLSAQTT